ncbi:hypothetical protein Kisp02_23610 [Kineosporia sp. NBRC 101731]|nr:hypothetical protein Kisp02_23610 [Kineosporia sp. NBRC 101731]
MRKDMASSFAIQRKDRARNGADQGRSRKDPKQEDPVPILKYVRESVWGEDLLRP